MTVEINDEFTAAVARPQSGNTMSYMWDTRADFADTGAPPRDGQYTLRVKSYDASEDRFRFLRSNELNVYVRNRISVAPTKTFRLAYSLSPDAQWQYTEKITAKQQGQQIYAANIPFTIMINEVTGGVASATERINRRAVRPWRASAAVHEGRPWISVYQCGAMDPLQPVGRCSVQA